MWHSACEACTIADLFAHCCGILGTQEKVDLFAHLFVHCCGIPCMKPAHSFFAGEGASANHSTPYYIRKPSCLKYYDKSTQNTNNKLNKITRQVLINLNEDESELDLENDAMELLNNINNEQHVQLREDEDEDNANKDEEASFEDNEEEFLWIWTQAQSQTGMAQNMILQTNFHSEVSHFIYNFTYCNL